MSSAHEESIELLLQWFEFWKDSDFMPAKMPKSLHTKTLTHLIVYSHENEGKDGVSELRERLAL